MSIHGIVTVTNQGTRGYFDRGGRSMCPSENNPGIVRVTRESVDTLTEGVGVCPSWIDTGIVTVNS